MATIRNTIDTQFTSRGARGVQQDTESVGRAQTRMGQASAGAGRSFAAQSQGLGGLVGAYAGAAATVFALEAAFTALASAAQAETIVKGTSALAAGIAQSGPQIIKSIQDITQSQLTLAEAAQNANIGLSAGFDRTQIEGLTKVAMQASRALGRNLTDSLQRVFRGVAKLEPELLDELGIFVRIEPAVAKYARQLGVAANSLTQFERGQAFANAAIEEGTRKFGMIDTTAPSAQKSLEQLQTQIQELAKEFGQFINAILLPFVNFLKNDAGNALVLFGGILLLVFSKALTMIGTFASGGLVKFTTFADGMIAKTTSMKAAIDALTASQATYATKMGSLGVTGQTGAAGLTTAQRTAQLTGAGFASNTIDKSGRYDSRAARKDGATLSRADAANAAEQRQKFISGTLRTKEAQDRALQSFRQVSSVLKQNSIAYQQTTFMINALTAAQTKMSLGAKLAAGSMVLLRNTVTFLGAALTKLMSIFSGVFMVAAVFDLMGFNIFGKIKDYFNEGRQAVENFETALAGVYSNAAGGSGVLGEDLMSLGASDKQLENVGKRINELDKEIRGGLIKTLEEIEPLNLVNVLKPRLAISSAEEFIEILNAQKAALEKSYDTTGERNEAFRKANLGGLINESDATAGIERILKKVNKEIELFNERSEIAGPGFITSEKMIAAIDEKIQDIRSSAGAAGLSVKDMMDIKLLEAGKEAYEQIDASLIKMVGTLSRLTGMNTQRLAKLFTMTEETGTGARATPDLIFPEMTRDPSSSATFSDTGNYNDYGMSFLRKGIDATGELDPARDKLVLFGIQLKRVGEDGEFAFSQLTKSQQELLQSSLTVTSAILDANDAFDVGATSADKLSAVIAGAANTFINSEDALEKYAKEMHLASKDANGVFTTTLADAQKEAKEFFDILRNRVADLIALRDALKIAEAEFKGLTKTFSKQIAITKNLRFGGYIDATGQLATKTKQLKENQNALLISLGGNNTKYSEAAQAVDAYNDALAENVVIASQMPLAPDAQQIADAEIFNAAREAIVGQAIEYITLSDKIIEKDAKAHSIAMATLEVKRATVAVAREQVTLSQIQQNSQQNAAIGSQAIAINAGIIQRNKNILTQANMEIEHEIQDIQHSAAMAQAKANGSNAAANKLKTTELRNQLGLLKEQNKLDELKDKPFVSDAQIKERELEIIAMRISQAKEEFDLQIAAIKASGANSRIQREADIKATKLKIKAELDANKQLAGHRGAKDLSTRERIAEMERNNFIAEQQLEAQKLVDQREVSLQQEAILAAQQDLVVAQRRAEDLKIEQQNALIDAQLDAQIEFATSILGFINGIDDFGKIVEKYVIAQGGDPSAGGIDGINYTNQITDGITNLQGIQGKRDAQRNDQSTLSAQNRAAEDELARLRQGMAADATLHLDTMISKQQVKQQQDLLLFDQQAFFEAEKARVRLVGLQQELELLEAQDAAGGVEKQQAITEATANYEIKLENLTNSFRKGDAALGKFDTDMGAISDTIDSSLITAFSDLGDILLGLGDETKSFGEQVKDVFRSFMMSIIKEIQMQMIVKPLAGAASGFISGLFGMASGGSVRHMADGGQVNALRDRVPAMLEPGEFVIRKNSAKSIGRSKLGQMNATGSAGMGNIEFNIVNEGAAKQAEQQGPPKFDTDKIIVEVVMRDLENNGPIRKALRG